MDQWRTCLYLSFGVRLYLSFGVCLYLSFGVGAPLATADRRVECGTLSDPAAVGCGVTFPSTCHASCFSVVVLAAVCWRIIVLTVPSTVPLLSVVVLAGGLSCRVVLTGAHLRFASSILPQAATTTVGLCVSRGCSETAQQTARTSFEREREKLVRTQCGVVHNGSLAGRTYPQAGRALPTSSRFFLQTTRDVYWLEAPTTAAHPSLGFAQTPCDPTAPH